MATRSRRRWWWLVLAGVVVAVVAAVVVGRFVLYRDTSTALSSDAALNRYRASTTVAAAPSPSSSSSTAPPPTTTTATMHLPPPGVYRYATTGQEHIDALGGTTHTYPTTTTITITPAGCGVQTRWDVLQERWMSRQLCLGDGGIVTGTYTDYHRFFGQDDRADWACQPPYVIVPAAATAGASWAGTCLAGTNHEDTSVAVVGQEPIVVGGEQIEAIHLQRVEKDQDKDASALSTTDQWVDPSDGLVLRETESSTSTTSSLIGNVHYDEHYEIVLVSRQPQQ
jgi:hypothetical protein